MQPKRTARNEGRPSPRGERVPPRAATGRRRPSEWTTDAKISAGVLCALAALCLGLVGWRFVESRFVEWRTGVGSAVAVSDAAHAALLPDPTAAETDAAPHVGRHVPPSPTRSTEAPSGAARSTGADSSESPRPPRALEHATGAVSLPLALEESFDPTVPVVPPAQTLSANDEAYEDSYPPSPHAAPPSPASRPAAVEIRADDSFWLIAERAYGTGAYYKALYRFHEASIAEPDRLPEGQSLEIPPLETLRELFPEDVPADPRAGEFANLRTYRTKRGDTALTVAQFELGDAARWTEIFRLNQRAVTSPEALLPENYELKLPPAPRTAAGPTNASSSLR